MFTKILTHNMWSRNINYIFLGDGHMNNCWFVTRNSCFSSGYLRILLRITLVRQFLWITLLQELPVVTLTLLRIFVQNYYLILFLRIRSVLGCS